jgi:hypothetical protein
MRRSGESPALCFCDVRFEVGRGPLSLWVIRSSVEECIAIVSRWIQREGQDLCEQLRQFGHAGTILFLPPHQYRAMVEAGQRDPRTAFEKRKTTEKGRNGGE